MKNGRVLALMLLLVALFSACDVTTPGTTKPSTTQTGAPQTTQPTTQPTSEPSAGDAHRFITDAYEYLIPELDALGLDIDYLRYLNNGSIYICQGYYLAQDCKNFIYDPETGTLAVLPDDIRMIKQLSDGSLFVKFVTVEEHRDGDQTYETVDDSGRAILDGESFEVIREFAPPEGVDKDFDVSPDGTRIAFAREEGFYVGDLDFKNETKLADSYPSPQEEKGKMIRYPKWLTNDTIYYKMLGYEWVIYCARINADGTENVIYEDTDENEIYPAGDGNFIYMETHGAELGLLNGETGDKQTLFSGQMEYQGFAHDSGGSWVSYLEHHFGSETKTDWTARFTIRDVETGRVLRQYTTTEQQPDQLQSAAASPDGRVLLFTDLNEEGRRVIYRMEVTQ